MFRGSVESAIQFLGSESQAAVTLAMRTLVYRKESARDKIVTAIERDMFRNTEEHPRQFQRLRHLIRLLGRIDAGSTAGPLAGLFDKELQHLASRPAEPPPLPEQGHWPHYDEVDREDANHTLAWLAVTMDRQVLARNYGERLTKLRDSLDRRWKARGYNRGLDAANVEETMNRANAVRAESAPPVRSASRIYQSEGVWAMAFSSDGKYLATGGRDGLAHIWNTADWTCTRVLKHPGTVTRLAFSPDGRFLYLAGGGPGSTSLLCRYDWRTGKEDKVYEGNEDAVSMMELSPDGRNMVTRGTYYKHPMHLWDTETGKILRSFEARRVVFMPQARSIARYSSRGCVIAPLESDRPSPVRIEEPFSALAFSSDEKYLLTVQETSMKDAGNGPLLAETPQRGRVSDPEASAWVHDDTFADDVHLAVSRNGQYAAVGASGVPLKLYRLSDMKLLKEAPMPNWDRNYTGHIAFSPDNKLLAVAQESRLRPRFLPIRPAAVVKYSPTKGITATSPI